MSTTTTTTKLTTSERALLTKYLVEAHGKERQLEAALPAQIAVTRHRTLQKALRDHLAVTKEQVEALDRRLDELDGRGSSALAVVGSAAELVVSAANVGLSLAKGPLVILRGTSAADRELRAVRDCYWNEAEEIAHYRVIETLAEQLGDDETAELARRHRAQEEEMQDVLERELPKIVGGTVADELGG